MDYDAVIIGGGINGAGAAQAAAAAGYTVALLEKSHLAAGTSSKSSKLIHGGLRYLETLEFGLVRESLRERALLLRLAPDLVRLQPFYLPIYRSTRRKPWQIRAGLGLYAMLGGLRRETWFSSVPRSAWAELDGLATADLKAVFRYHDAQTDDAMLTEAVTLSALDLGADLLMPAEFTGAVLHDDGCEISIRQEQRERTITCAALINAAGPWVNQVLAKVAPRQLAQSIELIQGAHIEVSGRCDAFYYVEAPGDGRAVFVMPWRDRTLVGTTETAFAGDPDRVLPSAAERDYLLSVLAHYFPRYRDCGVLAAWAGLRVLPASKQSAFQRSRETILQRGEGAAGARLLSIYGGKITSYRATAQKVVEMLAPVLPPRAARADTGKLPLRVAGTS